MFKPYKYTKEYPAEKVLEEKDVWELKVHIEPLGIDFKKTLSAVLVVSGLFLVTSQILLPWLTTPPAQKPLLKPITSEVLGVDNFERKREIESEAPKNLRPQEFVKVEFEFSELKRGLEKAVEPKSKNVPPVFYITIPKLEIEKAEVETNSQNLSPDERLGHYPGSALLGEVGNTFIYGHSASPMFFDPQNYRTIFSTLDKLKEGDEIVVEFGGKYFKYVVEKLVVLEPEDVKPLEPVAPAFLQQSYLTLMTCVPPGIRTKRLLVQARLVL